MLYILIEKFAANFLFCQKRCVQCCKIFDHFSSTNSAWTNRLRQIFEILRSLLPSMTTSRRYWLCIWGYQVFGWTLRSFPMWRYGDTYIRLRVLLRVLLSKRTNQYRSLQSKKLRDKAKCWEQFWPVYKWPCQSVLAQKEK